MNIKSLFIILNVAGLTKLCWPLLVFKLMWKPYKRLCQLGIWWDFYLNENIFLSWSLWCILAKCYIIEFVLQGFEFLMHLIVFIFWEFGIVWVTCFNLRIDLFNDLTPFCNFIPDFVASLVIGLNYCYILYTALELLLYILHCTCFNQIQCVSFPSLVRRTLYWTT